MKEGFLYEHCVKKVFETMAHYFVNLCSTNQFLEMLWRRRQQQQKKVCLIIMEASHAVLRQMMLSLELWLLSCWLYLITDESGRLLESGEALELRCSIGHHRRWQQQRKQRWATQQQPVLVGLMRAKNTIFHILRPFISQPDREERFIIVAWKMLKSFLKKRMLNLYVPSLPSLYIPPERENYTKH